MNDSHETVVTKYFAKITILFLQCIIVGVTEMDAGIVPIAGDAVVILVIDESR